MAEFTNPHMVKQTVTFSDGTETVINYQPQENAEEIETKVAEDVAVEDEMSEAIGTDPEVSSVDEETVSSTEEADEVSHETVEE
jgi:hypothetical protein